MQAEAVVDAVIPELERKLVSCQDILRYILAGNATFTIRSVETQVRYTYKISSIAKVAGKNSRYAKGSIAYLKEQDKYWVSLLVGPDNEHSFIYIGMINMKIVGAGRFYTTKGSYASVSSSEMVKLSPSSKAIDFVMRWLSSQPFMTPKIEVWHSGRCGRCGKKLTVPESIERGIGPDCAGKL